jgi:ribose transport system substrate-binding protein/inositol transport system substrate-binding protein
LRFSWISEAKRINKAFGDGIIKKQEETEVKRKLIVLTLVVLMIVLSCFGLVGCSSGTTPSETTSTEPSTQVSTPAETTSQETAEAPLTFAFFIAHTNNEFMANLAEAVETAGADAGVTVKVFAADSDPATQVSQMENTIAAGGIDGVLLDPCSADGITAGVEACVNAGVPIITFHEAISAQDMVSSFVGPNLQLIGERLMEQVVMDLTGEGHIGILVGGLGHTAQIAISDGFKKVLDQNPGIIVELEDTGEWTQDAAMAKAENWLSTGKQLDAIVCQNDGMAIGVLQAVKSANREGILIYGNDAVSQVVESVKAGKIAATVYSNSAAEAQKGIEVLIALANKEAVEKEYIIEPVIITKDNVSQYFPD